MSKSIKAALLSGLVFPGLGHFYLRAHKRGTLLAVTALASLYVLISNAVESALEITDKIQRGEIPIDPTEISRAVSAQAAADPSLAVSAAVYLFLIVWLIGIIDSYRAGRAQGGGHVPKGQD